MENGLLSGQERQTESNANYPCFGQVEVTRGSDGKWVAATVVIDIIWINEYKLNDVF